MNALAAGSGGVGRLRHARLGDAAIVPDGGGGVPGVSIVMDFAARRDLYTNEDGSAPLSIIDKGVAGIATVEAKNGPYAFYCTNATCSWTNFEQAPLSTTCPAASALRKWPRARQTQRRRRRGARRRRPSRRRSSRTAGSAERRRRCRLSATFCSAPSRLACSASCSCASAAT